MLWLQARDTSDDFVEAQVGTSLSIPRAISQPAAALLQHLQHLQQQQHHEQELPQHASSILQQLAQDTAELLQQKEKQQQQVLRRPGSSPGLKVPQALQLGGGPTEQFLQLLQQELNKVGTMGQANTQRPPVDTCCPIVMSCMHATAYGSRRRRWYYGLIP